MKLLCFAAPRDNNKRGINKSGVLSGRSGEYERLVLA